MMQCKDIPTKPILEFVKKYGGIGCNWFEYNEKLEGGHWHSVRRVMPKNIPEKLILAKMNNLINKGLIEGCTCGCRGDYEITEKGLKRLSEMIELKPCPFCGKIPDYKEIDYGSGAFPWFSVYCCIVGPQGKTKEDAIKLWNTRYEEKEKSYGLDVDYIDRTSEQLKNND